MHVNVTRNVYVQTCNLLFLFSTYGWSKGYYKVFFPVILYENKDFNEIATGP